MAVNFHSFIQTDEWVQLVGVLNQMKIDYTNEIVNAGEEGNVNKVMHLTGKIGMIEELKSLPEYLYANSRVKEEDKNA